MNQNRPVARSMCYREIAVGMREQHEYAITGEVYGGFLAAFGDYSPIHVDDAVAKECGFREPVMHGGILNGFLSHFVGMHFPGELSLLLSVDLRFSKPSYLGDQIQIEAVVAQMSDVSKTVVLNVMFTNLTQSQVVARARVQVMLRDPQ